MIKLTNRRIIKTVLLLLMLGWAFWLRFQGLEKRTSFWVDEASTAFFARSILEKGIPRAGNFTDWRYGLHYYVTALSLKFFGMDEFGARLPAVFFGVGVVGGSFLLGWSIGGYWLGLAGGFLNAFSVLEITWSRQARGYSLLQLLLLANLTALANWKKTDGRLSRRRIGVLLLLTALLSVATHPLGWLVCLADAIWFIVLRKEKIICWLHCPQSVWKMIFLAVIFLAVLWWSGFFRLVNVFLVGDNPSMGFTSNLRYYHAFFWRQYGLISFCAAWGLGMGLKKKWDFFAPPTLFLLIFSFFICFMFQPFVRYPLLVMPLVFFFCSYGFLAVTKKGLWSFLLCLFIVLNGFKFTLGGEEYYSLNADMREIPEPDFKEAARTVNRLRTAWGQDVVIVTTHQDPIEWYVGENEADYLLTQRPWFVSNCEKTGTAFGVIPGDRNAHSLSCVTSPLQFEQLIKEHHYGLVVMDRTELSNLSRELTDWVENNLVLEFRSARIESDRGNTWPVEVYSWGR